MGLDPDDGAVHARAMVDGVGAAMSLLDRDGRITGVNRAWRQFAEQGGGDPIGTGVGANYLDVCDRAAAGGDNDGRVVAAGLRSVLGGERTAFAHDYPCPAPGGGQRWFELTAQPVPDLGGAVVLHTDVTTRVLGERANFDQARQDQLTGLANRLKIQEVLRAELKRCSSASPLTVAILDLDLFKNVNDSLGHSVGDLLLVELAGRLKRAMPARALVGRLGGDEFVVMAPDCDDAGAIVVAELLQRAMAEPFTVAGTHLSMSTSVGLATADDPGQPPGDLMRDADVALYAAKDNGRARHHQFTPALRARASEKLAILSGLRRALRHGEFRLHYQPIVDLRRDQVGGYEALIRWDDPTRGMQPPATFIPLAEESGLIVPIGRWLLAEAAAQAARWAARGFTGRVGVNISAVHLSAGTLVDDVLEALDVAGLPPAGFVVEVTETAIATDSEASIAQLRALVHEGIEVAIDDFGVGYSSLGQLARMPAQILKLDRSLLPAGDGSALSRKHEAIARAVTTAGAALGMHVLAEGIETPEELAMVRSLGCALAQGYLLGRPQPPDAISLDPAVLPPPAPRTVRG